MPVPPARLLAVSILAIGLSAAAYVVSARLVRDAAGAREGRKLFALFWAGIATYGLLDATWALAVAWDLVPLAVSVTVLHLKIVSALAAFYGLVAYLLLVYTGRRGVIRAVLALYAAILLVVVYYYVWRDPIGHHVGTWGAALDYARPGGAFADLVVLLLFVPPGLSALAYAFLLRVARDRPMRLRVGVTAFSLLTLFAGLTMGWLNGRWPWWGLAEKLLALVAVLGVLYTLRPPRPSPIKREA